MSVVRVEELDERAQQWEVTEPRYCVYFFQQSAVESGSAASYSVESFLVLGDSYSEVKQWAESVRAGRRASIGVLVEQDESRGVVWLEGADPNSSM